MGQGMRGGLDLLIKAAKGIVVHAPIAPISRSIGACRDRVGL